MQGIDQQLVVFFLLVCFPLFIAGHILIVVCFLLLVWFSFFYCRRFQISSSSRRSESSNGDFFAQVILQKKLVFFVLFHFSRQQPQFFYFQIAKGAYLALYLLWYIYSHYLYPTQLKLQITSLSDARKRKARKLSTKTGNFSPHFQYLTSHYLKRSYEKIPKKQCQDCSNNLYQIQARSLSAVVSHYFDEHVICEIIQPLGPMFQTYIKQKQNE